MEEKQYIRVRVTTEARKERVEVRKDVFFIAVEERAREGRANARVKEILCMTLQCSPTQLRMIKGATSPSKTYLLHNNT